MVASCIVLVVGIQSPEGVLWVLFYLYVRKMFMMNDYLTIKETAEKWELTPRRVQKMCSDGRIEGAIKFGRDWAIPKDAMRPVDGRVTTGEYRNWRKNK